MTRSPQAEGLLEAWQTGLGPSAAEAHKPRGKWQRPGGQQQRPGRAGGACRRAGRSPATAPGGFLRKAFRLRGL